MVFIWYSVELHLKILWYFSILRQPFRAAPYLAATKLGWYALSDSTIFTMGAQHQGQSIGNNIAIEFYISNDFHYQISQEELRDRRSVELKARQKCACCWSWLKLAESGNAVGKVAYFLFGDGFFYYPVLFCIYPLWSWLLLFSSFVWRNQPLYWEWQSPRVGKRFLYRKMRSVTIVGEKMCKADIVKSFLFL